MQCEVYNPQVLWTVMQSNVVCKWISVPPIAAIGAPWVLEDEAAGTYIHNVGRVRHDRKLRISCRSICVRFRSGSTFCKRSRSRFGGIERLYRQPFRLDACIVAHSRGLDLRRISLDKIRRLTLLKLAIFLHDMD